jgi:hypothetical protein
VNSSAVLSAPFRRLTPTTAKPEEFCSGRYGPQPSTSHSRARSWARRPTQRIPFPTQARARKGGFPTRRPRCLKKLGKVKEMFPLFIQIQGINIIYLLVIPGFKYLCIAMMRSVRKQPKGRASPYEGTQVCDGIPV